MKKLFLASALALASLASQAETLQYDVHAGIVAAELPSNATWNNLDDNNSEQGNRSTSIINLKYSNSSSQVLLTLDELAQLKQSGKKARIKAISFKIDCIAGYFESGAFTIDLYAQNVESNTFPKSGSTYEYFSWNTENHGKVVIDATDESNGFLDVSYMGDNYTVRIPFDGDGFLYAGQSILLTAFTVNTLEDTMGGDIMDGVCSYSVGRVGCAGEYSESNLTGTANNTTNELPYFMIEFEWEEESNEPTVTEGEPDVTSIGENKDQDYNSGQGSGPHCLDYATSISQGLYTKNLLGNLINVEGNSVTKAKVTALTTYITTQGAYSGEPDVTVDVYIFNTDETAFPQTNGKDTWFDYSNSIHGSANFDGETPGWEDYSDACLPVKITLDKPFEYNGGSIVITWVNKSGNIDLFNNSQLGYYSGFKAAEPSTNVFGHKNNVTSLSGNLEYGDNYLPYLDVDYIPVTYTGGEVKPMIKVSEPVLAVVPTTDGKGNNITATFTIEDEANVGEYQVSVGTTKVGTFTGTEFTINYLPNPEKITNDLIVYVAPVGSGAATEGQATIYADSIAVLFDAPKAEAVEGKQVMIGSFKSNEKSMNVNAATQLYIKTTVPVATFVLSTGTSNNPELLYGDNEAYDELIPEGASDRDAARNIANTGGYVAFVKNNAFAVPVKYGEPQYNEYTGNGTVTVSPSVDFPIATYTVDKKVTYSLTPDVAYETSNKIPNALGNVTVKFTVNEENVTYTRECPNTMATEIDDENFVIYATSGNTIKYRTCDYNEADATIEDLTNDGGEIAVISIEDYLKGKRIDYAEVNSENEIRGNVAKKYFDADGVEFGGIIEVTSVTLGLTAVTDVYGNKANDITATITFNDPRTSSTRHDIYVGETTEALQMNNKNTEFTLHFLPYNEDVNITIKSDRVSTAASQGWTTISAEDINKLFVVEDPTVEVTDTDIHGVYNTVIPDATSMDVVVAGRLTVTAAVPAVDVIFEDNSGAHSFNSTHSELSAIFNNLLVESAEGPQSVAVVAPIFEGVIPVQYGWHDVSSANLEAKEVSLYPTVIYPIAQAAYSLTASNGCEVEFVEDLKFELDAVILDINVEDLENESKVSRKYAEELVAKGDTKYFTIYAPENHIVRYKIVEIKDEEPAPEEETPMAIRVAAVDVPAEAEYETGENIVKLPIAENKRKMVYYYAQDADGNANNHGYQFIDEEGQVSGIISIVTDGNADDVEYYNLQGVRVRGNLAPGLYIRRQGTSTVKVKI